MKASKAKRIAPRLEKPSADKLAGIVRRIDAYVPSDLPELPELDKMVLELNGFPSCTVDLPSSNVAQSASTERVGREANAEGDADVWLTTKRAILRDEKNTLPYDTTKQRILDYYSGVDGDADIQTERLKVTLICPLSKSRMIVPSRSRLCTHLQCFDLENFLRSNAKREKPKCPVCGVEADFDKMLVDEYFQAILSIRDGKPSTEVEFLHNGGFRLPKPSEFSESLPSSEAVITLSDEESEDGEVVDAESNDIRHGQRGVGDHQRADGAETADTEPRMQRCLSEAFVPRVSSGQTDFTCKMCDKRYPSEATLDAHLSASHLPQSRAYSCGTCGEGFATELSRDDHEDKAHGPKTFRCEVCRKKFSYRSAREQHKKVKGHANPKPQSTPAISRGVNDRRMTDVLQATNAIERTVLAGTPVSHEPPRVPSNVRMPLFHPYYRPLPAIAYPNYGTPPFSQAAAMALRYAHPANHVTFAPMVYYIPPPQGSSVFPLNPFVSHP